MRMTRTGAARHKLAVAAAVVAIFASACGGGGTTQTSAEVDAALENATANIAELKYTDNLALTEMLDVRTGNAVSLSEVVEGDRAVLLWYWAPH